MIKIRYAIMDKNETGKNYRLLDDDKKELQEKIWPQNSFLLVSLLVQSIFYILETNDSCSSSILIFWKCKWSFIVSSLMAMTSYCTYFDFLLFFFYFQVLLNVASFKSVIWTISVYFFIFHLLNDEFLASFVCYIYFNYCCNMTAIGYRQEM